METHPEVFISFKNLDADGTPTRDSELAREIHDFLAAQGIDVFCSNVSLEKVGVAAFKKAIDEALDSARALVAVGTSAKNLDSEWVRYEWDSFFSDILTGVKPDGRVFVYVEGMQVSSLPRALRQSQVFAHGPDGFDRLYSFIASAFGREPGNVDSKVDSAKACLARVLDQNESWRIGPVYNR